MRPIIGNLVKLCFLKYSMLWYGESRVIVHTLDFEFFLENIYFEGPDSKNLVFRKRLNEPFTSVKTNELILTKLAPNICLG